MEWTRRPTHSPVSVDIISNFRLRATHVRILTDVISKNNRRNLFRREQEHTTTPFVTNEKKRRRRNLPVAKCTNYNANNCCAVCVGKTWAHCLHTCTLASDEWRSFISTTHCVCLAWRVLCLKCISRASTSFTHYMNSLVNKFVVKQMSNRTNDSKSHKTTHFYFIWQTQISSFFEQRRRSIRLYFCIFCIFYQVLNE